MKKNNKKGFTLIELLVVVAIIAALSTVIITSVSSARSKGRDAQRLSDIKALQTALSLYYDTCNGYPGYSKKISDGPPPNPTKAAIPSWGTVFGTLPLVEGATFGGKKAIPASPGVLPDCSTPLSYFLSPFPQNPFPNGSPYTYCAIIDLSTMECTGWGPYTGQNAPAYRITFTLENTSGNLPGGKLLEATPKGITCVTASDCL